MYSVGWLVAYLAVLFLVAEPLRNTGKYTMADTISFRLRGRGVRAIAAVSTLAVTLFYMIAQMVGSGLLFTLLLPQFSDFVAIAVVGVLMLVYVLFGGMLATTWVQIIKASLLLATAAALSLWSSALSFLAAGVSHGGRIGARLRKRNEPAAAGPALPRALGRVESHFARARARFGNRGPAAHPHAILHGAVGTGRARLDGVGGAARGDFLSHDVVHGSRARRRSSVRSTSVNGSMRARPFPISRTTPNVSRRSTRNSLATASSFLRRTRISRRPCSRGISGAVAAAFVAAVAFATILASSPASRSRVVGIRARHLVQSRAQRQG